ncbi:hypothetical protein RHOER0001_1446 [Rhodococcus erythropolis SK121]|nr:hypothetical protein RHOER0001_1446 [Rhodococcus erythropolis SK121]
MSALNTAVIEDNPHVQGLVRREMAPEESALAAFVFERSRVVTRSTPPRRRVADQQAGAEHWYS